MRTHNKIVDHDIKVPHPRKLYEELNTLYESIGRMYACYLFGPNLKNKGYSDGSEKYKISPETIERLPHTAKNIYERIKEITFELRRRELAGERLFR